MVDTKIVSATEDWLMENFNISAEDGSKISATWLDAGEKADTLLVAPAMGVARRFYRYFAETMVASGYSVCTFDYRGMNRVDVESLKATTGSLTYWGRYDLDAAINAAASRRPAGRLYLIAHSFGAQMIGFAKSHFRLSAAICYASAHGYYRHWPESEHG
jgi:predicted alpha/beta hydrolase